jgi:hypothetical protein
VLSFMSLLCFPYEMGRRHAVGSTQSDKGSNFVRHNIFVPLSLHPIYTSEPLVFQYTQRHSSHVSLHNDGRSNPAAQFTCGSSTLFNICDSTKTSVRQSPSPSRLELYNLCA